MAVITLTTDFGQSSPYVGQMRGVILQRLPAATLVDITHTIPPQDIVAGAHVLTDAYAWFPDGSVHLVVVDPGVGTSRRILACEFGPHRFVLPDNGLISLLDRTDPTGTLRAIAIDTERVASQRVSHTFHGRDIMAPAAARIAGGVPITELGEEVSDWVRLDVASKVTEWGLAGCILWVDDFGNLISNVRSSELPERFVVEVAGRTVTTHVKTYGQQPAGSIVTLIGSSGLLEIAMVEGNAARRLDLTAGTEIAVRRR